MLMLGLKPLSPKSDQHQFSQYILHQYIVMIKGYEN